jgi:ferredoxin-type protein NapH
MAHTIRRWTISRHLTQLAVLGIIASPLAGLAIFQGNLAAARIAGLALADPLAALQVVAGARVAVPAFIGSALLVTVFYFLLGGRTFCAWACPVYLLTEVTDKAWRRLAPERRTYPLSWKRGALLLTLLLTLLTGLPLFETVSPIGVVGRAIAFGSLAPLLLLAAIAAVELAARRLWCRSLCPLGGFYALVGTLSPLRIRFSASACTGCNDCRPVCPVEEVLEPPLDRGAPSVASGECTRCGACIDHCSSRALCFGFGPDPKGGNHP